MTYSFQTFSVNQVLSSPEMNQVEVNIRDHVHGRNSVVKTGISWPRTAKSATFNISASNCGELFDCTGTYSITFDAAASLGAGFGVTIANNGSGTLTLDPNGAETIDGNTTRTVGPGGSLVIWCDGNNLFTLSLVTGWQYLSTTTLSSDATKDIEDQFTGYDVHLFVLDGIVPASDGVNLRARLKLDGAYPTASYKWTSRSYATDNTGSNGLNDTTSATSIWLTHNTVDLWGNDTDEIGGGLIYLHHVNDANRHAILRSKLMGERNGQGWYAEAMAYYNGSPTSRAVGGLELFFSSGNLASGNIHHFGLKAA